MVCDVELEIRVRYHEVDQMGVAYHPRYLSWFEVARMELLRGLGLPYDRTEAAGTRFPVVRASCDYRRPLGYDDWFVLQARVLEVSGARFSLGYRILTRGERVQVHAEGMTEHAVVRAGTGRPTRLPAELVAAFARLPSQGGDHPVVRGRDPVAAALES